MLLFRDLIRLFACYNDGIINLLGKLLLHIIAGASIRKIMLLSDILLLPIVTSWQYHQFIFLEKYFDMNKKNAREALDSYKKFLIRMDRVAEFLKVAEVCTIWLIQLIWAKCYKSNETSVLLIPQIYHDTSIFETKILDCFFS